MPADESAGSDEERVEQATAWFVRMRSDAVTTADRRAFTDWLTRDPRHAAAYAEAETLWGELGGLPDPRTDRAEGPGADRRRASPDPRARRGRAGLGRLSGALAACVALAAVALWTVGGYDGLRADYRTAVGELRTVTLPDGSTVELDTDTALAVDFSPVRRRIELYRGEAFFTVAKDADRPFEVVAGGGVTRAVGTEFGVSDGGDSVTVAVEEGRVKIGRSGDGRVEDAVTVSAGEVARYDRTGDVRTAAAARRGQDVAAALAWRRGRVVFTDWPLRDVVTALDRYRPGAIFVLDSDIAAARFTGVFSLRDTDRALDAIEGSLAVDVVRITPYLTFLRARN